MIRADPVPPAAAFGPLPVPAWGLPASPAGSRADAAFYAGAALTSLDNFVRSAPAFAGCWRQRLALQCALANCRLAGRSEDEAALRDAWHLRRPGDDPGPGGAIYGAWRQRLALAAAAMAARAAVVKLQGRAEDESQLRDAWYLRQPGDAFGPAGNVLLAWRKLAGRGSVATF